MMFGLHIVRMRGELELTSALHIGSGAEDDSYGALVMRNSRGEPVIPASTLAGLLRGIATHLALAGDYAEKAPCLAPEPRFQCGQCAVCRVFGAPGKPSAWEFDDAAWADCQASGSDAREVRDSVGIGRQSGAAAHERLFAQEVVPRSARFVFEGCLHAEEKRDIALAVHCLEFWKEWGGRAGKASSSGLGAFTFEYTAEQLDADKPAEFAKYLYGDPIAADSVVAPEPVGQRPYEEQVEVLRARPRLLTPPEREILPELPDEVRQLLFEAVRWHITLLPVGPLQIKTEFGTEDDVLQVTGVNEKPDEKEADQPDAAFLRTGRIECKSIIEEHFIPGRSLKGLIRSHCERILRTCWALGGGDEQYLGAQHTVVCDPNYSVPAGGQTVPRLQPCKAGEPCPACKLFGSTDLGGRVTVSEAFPVCPDRFREKLKTLQRVSIDRITAGAADKRLFSGRPLFPPREPDPSLSLSFSVEMECPAAEDLGLMLFVLRDLCRERLRVGFGKYAGQGKVRAIITGCDLMTRDGSPLHEALSRLPLERASIGCLSMSSWASKPGVDLREWYEQFKPLGEWATDGWTDFLRKWAPAKPEEKEATTGG